MPRLAIVLLVAILIVIALVVWWRQTPDRAAAIASAAGSAEQERLWREVSERGTPEAIDRLPTSAAPSNRQSPQPPSQPGGRGGGGLAPGVTSGARVLSTSDPGEWQYSGTAIVSSVSPNGERIELLLGDGRRIAFAARVEGKPLGVSLKEAVSLHYSTRPGVSGAERIFGVQTKTGAAVISATSNGEAPVTLTVPLSPTLTLVAAQTGAAAKGATAVALQIGGAKEVVQPGTTTQVGGVAVSILSSLALPGLGTLDGSPYGIDLLAWRTGGGAP